MVSSERFSNITTTKCSTVGKMDVTRISSLRRKHAFPDARSRPCDPVSVVLAPHVSVNLHGPVSIP